MFLRNKKISILFSLILVVVLVISFVGCGKSKDEPITVGSKAWTEQLILGNMLLILLEENGYPVEDRTGLGETPVLRPALHSGEIDVYWEYTGTTLMTQMEHEKIASAEEAYELVKEWDKKENNVIWMDYPKANNTYTLMMRGEHAQELGIESISDLAEYINAGNDIRLATDVEFLNRPDGIPGIEEKYSFEFDDSLITTMAVGLNYGALKDEKVDVAMGFATDGRIPAFGFINLEDDKTFFPIYNPTPIIRQEIIDMYPELPDLINKLPALLDDETLANLNKSVDLDENEPEEVAEKFLKDNGLIE